MPPPATPTPALQAASLNQIRVATGIDRAVAAGGNASPFFNLYNQNRAGILVGLGDGSGRLVSASVSPDTWAAALTPDGGEVLGSDW